MSNLEDLELVCKGLNGDGKCSLDGKKITYQNFVKDHIEACYNLKAECSLKCGTKVSSNQEFRFHLNVC